MTDSQEREKEHDGSRPDAESPARPPRVSKLPERSHQQPIAALEHDRCSRDGERGQRIPLQLDNRWEERWVFPHALPSKEPPAACHLTPASRARALAAEDREAQKRRGADGGLMERAMPPDSGEHVGRAFGGFGTRADDSV